MTSPAYESLINIPAYDASNNGLLIEFKLTILPDSSFQIKTIGKVAAALYKNFSRIIEIMSSMKPSWQRLESIGYKLESNNDLFLVKDSKSSSMALSIALINAHRALNGKPQIPGLSGSGILRIDGSFDSAHLEETKYLAAKQHMKHLHKFITAQECSHLFALEKLINQYE